MKKNRLMAVLMSMFVMGINSPVSNASEVDVEFGLGGVFQRSGGIKDWDNDPTVSKVRMPGLGQMNVFFTDRFGLVAGLMTGGFSSKSRSTTNHYHLGLKANIPIGGVRFSVAGGVGHLTTPYLGPNSDPEHPLRTYHPKTVYGEAAIDLKLGPIAYVGISYFFVKANEPGIEIDSIAFSGAFHAVYLKLGFMTPLF